MVQIAGYEFQPLAQGCRSDPEIRIGQDCPFFFKSSTDSAVNLRGSKMFYSPAGSKSPPSHTSAT
jgi:hypothetical protein